MLIGPFAIDTTKKQGEGKRRGEGKGGKTLKKIQGRKRN